MSEIKKMCKAQKLSDKGSKLDCLQRLKVKLKTQSVYQEMHTKFSGSSGKLLLLTGHSVLKIPIIIFCSCEIFVFRERQHTK